MLNKRKSTTFSFDGEEKPSVLSIIEIERTLLK